MRVFHDWEFIEDGVTIAPISVALVADIGREYYAIFDNVVTLDRAYDNPWLRENVLPYLPITITKTPEGDDVGWVWDTKHPDYGRVKPRRKIAQEVKEFLQTIPDVELWAWFGAYDHVCLAQLFGCMIDLPTGIPRWTNDLKQEAVRLGSPQLPEQAVGQHNALADARHNRSIAHHLDRLSGRTPSTRDQEGQP